MKTRLAAVAALALGVLVLFAAPANAQYDQILSCSFDRVVPGDVVTAAGNGFKPDSTVVIVITDDGGSIGPGDPFAPGGEISSSAAVVNLGTTQADAQGEIDFTFVVPGATDLPPGDYFVTATGVLNSGDAPRQVSCPFTVLAVPATGPIAFTGSNSKPIAEVAIAMIALGGLAVVVARRRLASQSADVPA